MVFCVSGFQYLVLAVVVSKGPPFRKPLYTNGKSLRAAAAQVNSPPKRARCSWRISVQPVRPISVSPVLFLVALISLCGLMVWLTACPLAFMQALLHLKSAGDASFKAILLGMAALHFFTAFLLEVTGGSEVGKAGLGDYAWQQSSVAPW